MLLRLLFLFVKIMLIIMVVNWFTFIVVLPKLCRNLGYSMYYAAPVDPYERLNDRNDRRIEEANNIFKNYFATDKYVPLNTQKRVSAIEFALIIVSVQRNKNPHYLLQVVARLLPQVKSDGNRSHLIVLNMDREPAVNEDAVYLSKFVPVVTREKYLHVSKNTFEKEKQDYVMALEVGLTTGSTYVVVIEDDAMPVPGLLSSLRIILSYKMPWSWLRSNSNVAFLKLYYPEKWQGFGFPEIPEVICITVLMSSFITFVHKKLQNLNHPLILGLLFIIWASYSVLVMYSVGRQHLIEIRKLSPFLHTVASAPGCCTPAVLYSRHQARQLVRFLKNSTCSQKYPLDFALDDFSNKLNLRRYLVTPNLFTHIGVYSSLHATPKHFREFDLLFEP